MFLAWNGARQLDSPTKIFALWRKHEVSGRAAKWPNRAEKRVFLLHPYNPVPLLVGCHSVETVLGFARTMKWKGQQAVVKLVDQVYQTGVRLSQKAMAVLEERLERLAGLERWFVRIEPQPQFAFG